MQNEVIFFKLGKFDYRRFSLKNRFFHVFKKSLQFNLWFSR
eukprot:UN23835